ncbi:waprin-Rha1 [Tribolium castaneum]|uniref:WAP four-disulfide core domain-like protein n=1 Tax=Tribolium castaneum TaxID=7070 RepID=D6X3Z5_TRICA|nr:PREDICTED: waprin-Rha1 [Tribolium castaneum]EEZ97731.1 WAP four-disulfide core domain-like protein [Tribolium castaneum]|eukprot:XP_969824.1 PREDICTED: waprin-Rha1 [Tribolium castaneum]
MQAKLFLILSLLTVFVYGQRPRTKSGDCPPYPNVGICEVACFEDNHCAGHFKCCRTACGGTFCTAPVTTRRIQRGEKQGSCPVAPSGPWVCSSRCALDSDCRGAKKCCRNRCGAMACTKPEF